MIERLTILGQTRTKNLNPSGRLTRIEGLLSEGYGRMDQGQERTGKGRPDGSRPSWRTLISAVFKTLLMVIINLALVGIPSRRLVILETVFGIPDPNPLPYFPEIPNTQSKLSVLELKTLTADDLKKRLTELINIKDWTDKCSKCGYPKLIHKNLNRDATCIREAKAPDVLNKHWEEYMKRIKPILKALKEEFKKGI